MEKRREMHIEYDRNPYCIMEIDGVEVVYINNSFWQQLPQGGIICVLDTKSGFFESKVLPKLEQDQIIVDLNTSYTTIASPKQTVINCSQKYGLR